MALDHIDASAQRIWGFWKIIEDEQSLASAIPEEKITSGIANPNKRLEFLAGRVLIKSLLKHWNLPYHGLTKDAFGKPFLSKSSLNISLTHSYPYVAAILHRNKNVGIDLEQPKSKLLTIAPRVLADEELKDAGTDIVKHCVYWCAKESLIKIHGKKDLILAKQLAVKPFLLGRKGQLIGRIIANKTETAIPLSYIVYENFVVVVSK